MSEAVPSSSCVHSDTFTETGLVAQPADIVLVNSPPDYVKQISRHLTSSVGQQSGRETNSDSGDSLFITQKCTPERRRRSSKRSAVRAHRGAPEHEYDTSTSEGELEGDRKQNKKIYRTPRFTFPFLKRRLMRLPYYQNRKLHYCAIGGYLKCVEQLWESFQTGEGLVASLPTVDVGGEPISPILEEEDETIEDEDIKVVEKKLFVASKAKSSQPWYNPRKRSSKETQQNQCTSAAYGSQRGQGKTTRRISTWTPLSKGRPSLKTKESDQILEEAESGIKSGTKAGNLTTETGTTIRSPRKGSGYRGFILGENGKMLDNDIDATCRGLSAEQYTELDEQTCSGDIECGRIKVKKAKKTKKDRRGDECVEEGKDQSLGVTKGQQADPFGSLIMTEAEEAPCLEKKKHENEDLRQKADEQSDKRKEEKFVVTCEAEIGGKERRKKKEGNADRDSVTTSKAPESTTKDGHVPKKRKKKEKDLSDLHQTLIEHPEIIDHSENGETSQETLESIGLKKKKHKKKKKNQSLSNDNQTDVNFSNDATTVAENTNFVKLKKKKNVCEVVEPPEDDKRIEKTQKEKQDVELESRKKKKKKKVKDDTSIIYSEDTLTSGDYSELVWKKNKRRTPSFLSADKEEQRTPVQSASAHEGHAEKHEVSAGEVAAESADVSEHLQESKGGKKKKKRSAAVPESEEREPEETSEAAVRKKKKRKITESLKGGLASVADVGSSQTEEAVVVRKKKKKKKKKEKGAQEVPPAASGHSAAEKSSPNACSSLSANQKLLMDRKGKRRRVAETSRDSSLSSQQQATETLAEGASDLHASGDVKDRKKKKKSADKNVPEGKSCTHTANGETHKTKRDRTKPLADSRFTSRSPKTFAAELETSSSHCVKGKRGVHARRLHNPDKDFLSDLSC